MVFITRGGLTLYWCGTFDEFYQPRETPVRELAATFISAAHAYRVAGEHARMKHWRVRRIADTRHGSSVDWDRYLSEFAVRRLGHTVLQ